MTPQLIRLIDVGVLARAARADGVREDDAFDELAGDATRRGELTAEQATALATLLGLLPRRPANDR